MLIQEEITIPELSGDKKRRLFIWIPDDWEEDSEQRYPVLYMFDGHNVFMDETATYGKSWGLMDYLSLTGLPLIVVAPECNHEGHRRLEEYLPYTCSMSGYGRLQAQGEITMRWMTETLKPWVDEEFPTIPDRRHTFIAGSSMGGLMSLYAVTHWNHIFSGAAALSPSVYAGYHKLMHGIKGHDLESDTRVYMDLGSEEVGYHPGNLEFMEKINHVLLGKGADTCMRIVSGGNHSEASWERQVPIFMHCLGITDII